MYKGFPCFHSFHIGRNGNLPFLQGNQFSKQDKNLMTLTPQFRGHIKLLKWVQYKLVLFLVS